MPKKQATASEEAPLIVPSELSLQNNNINKHGEEAEAETGGDYGNTFVPSPRLHSSSSPFEKNNNEDTTRSSSLVLRHPSGLEAHLKDQFRPTTAETAVGAGDWHRASLAELQTQLRTNIKLGLSTIDAQDRITEFGLNEIRPKDPESVLHRFLMSLLGGFQLMLLVGGVLSFIVFGLSPSDVSSLSLAITLVFVVVLTSMFQTYQEGKADQVMEALRAQFAQSVFVIRHRRLRRHHHPADSSSSAAPGGGHGDTAKADVVVGDDDGDDTNTVDIVEEVTKIDSKFLVPGDVVVVKAGEKVPADLRIVECDDLKVNNSILTGENVDVRIQAFVDDEEEDGGGDDAAAALKIKHASTTTTIFEAKNICRSGCSFTSGHGRGVVFATGEQTMFGQIAAATLQTERPSTTLQAELRRIILYMTVFSLIIGGIFLALTLTDTHYTAIHAATFTIGIIVANVPEGLLPQLSVALALAANRLRSKDVLVSNLEVIETLGAVTVICSDKTGTLTQNKMSVSHLVFGGIIFDATMAPHPPRPPLSTLSTLSSASSSFFRQKKKKQNKKQGKEGGKNRQQQQQRVDIDNTDDSILDEEQNVEQQHNVTMQSVGNRANTGNYDDDDDDQVFLATSEPLENLTSPSVASTSDLYGLKLLLDNAILNSTATFTSEGATNGDASESAMLRFFQTNYFDQQQCGKTNNNSNNNNNHHNSDIENHRASTGEKLFTLPFNSKNKYMVTVKDSLKRRRGHETQQQQQQRQQQQQQGASASSSSSSSPTATTNTAVVLVKGAPERVFERCSTCYLNNRIINQKKKKITHQEERAARRGFDDSGDDDDDDDGGYHDDDDDQSSSSTAVVPFDGAMKHYFEKLNLVLAERGERVFALAERIVVERPTNHNNNNNNSNNGTTKWPTTGLTLVGLISLRDPPRPGVRESIRLCHTAGIKVVMVTGDHPSTAVAIAKSLGLITVTDVREAVAGAMLPPPFVEGEEVEENDATAAAAIHGTTTKSKSKSKSNQQQEQQQRSLYGATTINDSSLASNTSAPPLPHLHPPRHSSSQLDEKHQQRHQRHQDQVRAILITGPTMESFSQPDWDAVFRHYDEIVFARTLPQQKQDIVQQLNILNHIIAMTGDGVNDAPALKAAHVGVAMGSGTQVAKEAAQIVLLTDDFSAIVTGVREGRSIFENMRKAVVYVLNSNVAELVPFLIFIAARVPLAIETIVILFVDLATDLLPSIALAYEEPEDEIMERPPRRSTDHLMSPQLFAVGYLTIGALETLVAFFAFFYVFADYGIPVASLGGLGTEWDERSSAFDVENLYFVAANNSNSNSSSDDFQKLMQICNGSSSFHQQFPSAVLPPIHRIIIDDNKTILTNQTTQQLFAFADSCFDFREHVAREARSVYFLTVVWGQVANIFMRKTQESSVLFSANWWFRLTHNRFMLVSVLIEIAIAMFVTHVPGVNTGGFGLATPSPKHACVGLWTMLLLVVWEETRKWLLRRSGSNGWFTKIARF